MYRNTQDYHRNLNLNYDYNYRSSKQPRQSSYFRNDYPTHFTSTRFSNNRFTQKHNNRQRMFCSQDYNRYRQSSFQKTNQRERYNQLSRQKYKRGNYDKKYKYQNQQKEVGRIYRTRSYNNLDQGSILNKYFLETSLDKTPVNKMNRNSRLEARSMSQTGFKRNLSAQLFKYNLRRQEQKPINTNIDKQKNKKYYHRQLRNTDKPKSFKQTPTPPTPSYQTILKRNGSNYKTREQIQTQIHTQKPKTKEVNKRTHSGLKYVSSVKEFKQKPFWFKSRPENVDSSYALRQRIKQLLDKY